LPVRNSWLEEGAGVSDIARKLGVTERASLQAPEGPQK